MQTAEKEPGQAEIFKSGDRLLDFDLSEELNHGIAVSNLAYAVARTGAGRGVLLSDGDCRNAP